MRKKTLASHRFFAAKTLLTLWAVFVFVSVVSTSTLAAPATRPGAALSFEELAKSFRVSVIDGKVFIDGSYNDVTQDWSRWQNKSFEAAGSKGFSFLVHAGSSPSKIARMRANPHMLSEAISLSVSLINDAHRTTYGKYGFILKVPPENIIATSSADMGSPFSKSVPATEFSEIKEDLGYPLLIAKNPVLKPAELLAGTLPGKYNEIMVTGTTRFGKVEIVAVFLKTRNGQVVESKENEANIRDLAKNVLRVPLVTIEGDHIDPSILIKNQGLGIKAICSEIF
jgi:hypothetical protein